MNIYIRTQDNDLFKYFSDQDYALVMARAEAAFYKSGEILCEAGTIPDSFMMVQEGELELFGSHSIGNIYPGEFCGELFFLSQEPSPFNLRAAKDSYVLRLGFSELKDLIEARPELMARIQAAINDSLCLKIIRLTHRRNNG
jgi:CRP-like cAMP-binding protein